MKATIAVLLLFFARAAAACSCINATQEQAFAHAPFVFAGVVEKIENAGEWERRVTFRVMQWWKGEQLERTIDVWTGRGGGDCGYPFETGQSFLVMATRMTDNRLATGICTGTAALICTNVEPLGEPIKTYERFDRKTLLAREQPYTTYWRPCIQPARLIGERGLDMNKHCMFTVDGIIDRDGTVRDFRIVREGLKFCSTAHVIERVAAWRFRPATIDGLPVQTRLTRVSMREPETDCDYEKEKH
ncbi:MAG TPA: hypothetical protein VKB93_08065 [Thermoanaerobaculia bacterium]|nr:hypothetical protein [Thermoanaerobaculia bacterium]